MPASFVLTLLGDAGRDSAVGGRGCPHPRRVNSSVEDSGGQCVKECAHCRGIAAVVSHADVAVGTHGQDGHVVDSELRYDGFVHPPDVRACRAGAQGEDRVDYRVRACLELGEQASYPARVGVGTAEDDDGEPSVMGEFVQWPGVTVRRLDVRGLR